MSTYEILTLVNPEKVNDWEKKLVQYKTIIQKTGGNLLLSENYGLKQLFYIIKKTNNALYYKILLQCQSNVIKHILKMLNSDKFILRFLILKIKVL